MAAMNCNVAIVSMHDYLDGELTREDAAKLKAHMIACPECRARFEKLERTEALIHNALEIRGGAAETGESALRTQRIMSALPLKQRKSMGWTRWLRNHPAIAVAAVFAFVMLASFITMWEQDDQLTVRGNDLTQLVIDGDTVTVPEGVHVKGDLTVENGKANVLGDVEGNVTVIEGSLYQASTAHISGQVKTIDQALDWFWYKVTHSFSSLAY